MNSKVFSFSTPSLTLDEKDRLRVAIQPNMSCEGWPATAGSMALENYVALENATVIRSLKNAGSTIVGSSHMCELGLGLVGDTSNQAITENLADLALVTDHMGEARVAAAQKRLAGFKPSYGIVSRLGLIGLIPSMECWGILARDVETIKSAMATICVSDEQDFSMLSENLPSFDNAMSLNTQSGVIGIAEGYEKSLSKAENEAWQKVLSELEKAGFQLKAVQYPDPSLFSAAHHVIGAVEASSSAGKYDGVRYGHRTDRAENWNDMYLNSRGESFGTFIKAYLFQGAYFQFENYAAFENACRLRGRLLHEAGEIFQQVDWVASLTIRENHDASKVSGISDLYEAFSFTVPASITGFPALQIPGIAISGNTDFGVQITGRFLSDPQLLALGEYLMQKEGGPEK